MKKATHVLNLALALTFAAAPAVARSEDTTYCLQGLNASHAGSYAKSIELFNACIEHGALQDDFLASTYRNLAVAYRNSEQPVMAVQASDKAIGLHPADVANDYVNRGNAFDDQGKSQQAFDDYNHALALQPDNVDALYNRGVAYEHRSDFSKARSDFIAAYNGGLRSALLHERLVMYRMIKPGNPDEWTPL